MVSRGKLVAVTYGAAGAALFEDGREVARAEPPQVVAVDGTAAGDSFAACLVVSLLEGRSRQEALERACAAGAIAASRHGAQPSLPDTRRAGGDARLGSPGAAPPPRTLREVTSSLAWWLASSFLGSRRASQRRRQPRLRAGGPPSGGGPARTDEAAPVGSLTHSWFTPVPGMVTTQPLVVPGKSDQTVYVGTAAGYIYALAPNGYVRWRVDLGHQFNSCPQIPDGWGITGTPAADPLSGVLYVVDAFGRLHALDTATGRERSGWPIALYSDYEHELDWGASIIVEGSLYVPTGSFCDLSPMEGKLIRVDLATKQVSSWVSVPSSLGGGGSILGWGGPAYSTKTDSLYVGTANTFEGGSNTGAAFDQQAGYGEQLVQLSRSLKVVAASKPNLGPFPDNGFVGSPVIVDPPGCGELIAAQTKSGAFLGWRADDVAAGPIWQLQVQPSNTSTPLLTQIAYSSTLNSFFDVTWTSLIRLADRQRLPPADHLEATARSSDARGITDRGRECRLAVDLRAAHRSRLGQRDDRPDRQTNPDRGNLLHTPDDRRRRDLHRGDAWLLEPATLGPERTSGFVCPGSRERPRPAAPMGEQRGRCLFQRRRRSSLDAHLPATRRPRCPHLEQSRLDLGRGSSISMQLRDQATVDRRQRRQLA